MSLHSLFGSRCIPSGTSLKVWFIALYWIGAFSVVYAQNSQPAIVIRDGRTFLAGEVSIGGDISAIETNSFTCTPIQPFKKGDKVAAMVSDNQAWSVDKRLLQVGAIKVAYPILAMVKSAEAFVVIVPGVLKTKTDIKAGAIVRSDGYQIETTRVLKAGDIIAVLFVGESLLSAEAAEGAKDESEAKPWFTAYEDGMEPNARSSAIEAWRIAGQYVAGSGSVPPTVSSDIRAVAEQGDSEKVQALLKENPALVASKNSMSRTPLHLAAAKGHKNVVEVLLANHADVNAKDVNNETPLHFAAASGSKEVAELLLAEGAEVNAKSNGGRTPLHSAAISGFRDVTELLLAKGAEVNAKDGSGWTALHAAAYKGSRAVAELLLANKADVNARETDGDTPLRTAERSNQVAVAELLRQHGGHE